MNTEYIDECLDIASVSLGKQFSTLDKEYIQIKRKQSGIIQLKENENLTLSTKFSFWLN